MYCVSQTLAGGAGTVNHKQQPRNMTKMTFGALNYCAGGAAHAIKS